MKNGFTLIELLVVVLIIGILAAVALPQYNVSVEKARLGRVMANVKTLKNSLELYWLANGVYPEDTLDGLDVGEISGCTSTINGQLHCAKEWYDYIFYKDGQVVGFNRPHGENMNGYVLWLDKSALAGRVECLAVIGNETAQKVCKSMGGIADGNTGVWTKYALP